MNTDPDYTPKNFWWRHLRAILLSHDVQLNAYTGGAAYQTLSCRIGVSILGGTWASKIPWPEAFREHFVEAVYSTVV